jgi:signal peptidase II
VSGRGVTLGWRAAYLLAAALLYLVDQMTKAWAVRRLRLGDTVRVVEGFLHFGYAENTGIAFGQLQEGGQFGRWMLAGLAAAAAVGVLVYFFRVKSADDRVLGACALLLAGIAGNLTDRVRLGYVVDFIEVHLGSYQWPTFNVADAAICVGAGLLALDLILEGRREGRRQKAEGSQEAEGGAR